MRLNSRRRWPGAPGERVRLTIVRDGKRRDVSVELGEFEVEGERVAERKARPVVEEVIGFRVEPAPQEGRSSRARRGEGVVIGEVARLSPAARAGVVPGLILLRLNGEEVRTVGDVERIAGKLEPGSVVSLVVRIPDGEERIINYRTRR